MMNLKPVRQVARLSTFFGHLRFAFGIALGVATGSAVHAQAEPVTLNIVDVGGALALLQTAVESYGLQHPNVKFTFRKAIAVELPKTLGAATTEVDLVLGGTDILAAGIDKDLWVTLLPNHVAKFPGLMDRYLSEARRMQGLAQNQALAVVFTPGGPFLEYNPAKVKVAPQTPEELLAWCKANPGRFTYARPANSGPGRTFMMGLPYLLGDKDPKDPINGWEKTWGYLKALNTCIDSYPGTTGALMKALGAGERDMTVTTAGWDIFPRATGTVPKDYKVSVFKNMTWINDTLYMMVPKTVSAQRLPIVLDLMAHLLKREQQALTYDTGYFYPGPAIKNVPYSLATPASQKVLRDFGRTDYILLSLSQPHTQPLPVDRLNMAFKIWDEEVAKPK